MNDFEMVRQALVEFHDRTGMPEHALDRIEAEVTNYREAFEADEKTIGELQAEVERLRKRLEIGQNLAGDLSREVKRLRAENDGLSEQVAEYHQALDEARCSHRTLAEWDERGRQLFHERETVAALAHEAERLQAIIQANDNYDQDATEREVERLRHRSEVLVSALARKDEAWETAEAAVRERDNDIDKLEAEVERLEAENRQLRRRV
jgi:chromosome segregation ATPase